MPKTNWLSNSKRIGFELSVLALISQSDLVFRETQQMAAYYSPRLSLQLAPRSGSRVDSEFRHSCCSSIRRWRAGLIFRRQPRFGGGDHGLEAGIVAERIEVWIDLGVV